MSKKAFVLAKMVVAITAVIMLGYRIYLAYLASGLSAAGSFEEALFVLAADPLWRVELSLAQWVGSPGSLATMNTLAFVLWGLIALSLIWVAIRGLAQQRGKT